MKGFDRNLKASFIKRGFFLKSSLLTSKPLDSFMRLMKLMSKLSVFFTRLIGPFSPFVTQFSELLAQIAHRGGRA